MVSEWEKQILAYCIRVSRGTVRKGILKMSIFSEQDAEALGGITVIQLVDIMSYLSRLHTNLKDPIRRRGFNCNIEIGHKIHDLITELGYRLDLLNKDFCVSEHDGYANEIRFYFIHEPEIEQVIVFEDIEVAEHNYKTNMQDILQNHDSDFEFITQQKFVQEFDFIDDIPDTENQDTIELNASNKKIPSKN